MSFFASVRRSRSNCSMEFGSRVLEEKKGTPHELQHPSGPIIRGTVIGEAAAVVVAVGGAALLSTPTAAAAAAAAIAIAIAAVLADISSCA
jgi:hypothetical protein